MNQIRTINWRDPLTIAWLGIGLLLLANAAIGLLQVFNKHFNPDEFQHLHIGWLIANGEVMYRDFWEHHGPLYGLLNGALIYLTDAEPSMRIAFWSRLLSYITMCGISVLIWQIARQLTLSRLGAGMAVVAYSLLIIVHQKGIEMRPDSLQTLFWIAGLYLLLRNQSNGNLKRAILAGVLFTLSILANSKAGLGPFFVVLFYLTGHWLCGLSWADIWRDMRGMTIGACMCFAPFLVYFLATDSLYDFFYYNFIWNVEVIFHWTGDFQFVSSPQKQISTSAKNVQFFLDKQLPFLLLSIIGAILWLGKLGGNADQATRQRNWLFLIVSVGTTLGWKLDLYIQYFLMFLPFWAIFASYALLSISNFLTRRSKVAGLAVVSLIAILAAGVMFFHLGKFAEFRENPYLTKQKIFTQRILDITERDEPVGIIWSRCGGYMFNQDVGYYWVALADISEIIRAISGEHPHGQEFIEEMEERQVRHVIGMEFWLTEGMSVEAMDYLRENFDYTDCLWTRKTQ